MTRQTSAGERATSRPDALAPRIVARRPRAVAERASKRYAFGANLGTYGGSVLLLIALAITGFRHGFSLFVAGFFVGGVVSAFAAYVAYDNWVQRGLP